MQHQIIAVAFTMFLVCLPLVQGRSNFSKVDASPVEDDISSLSKVAPATLNNQRHRSLRLSQYYDPKSTVSRIDFTITVHLVRSGNYKVRLTSSIFKTGILQRYGSGRVQYIIREQAECSDECNPDEEPLVAQKHAPCLAVSRDNDCNIKHRKCNYRQCKTMVIGDELCKNLWYDVRTYYTSDRPELGYLPLGPRLDAWTSFQKIREHPQFFMVPASKRKYAFNAIFSKSTNPSRTKLATIIDKQMDNSNLSIFTTMAERWSLHVNKPESEQLGTDQYMEVVLDSVFTLSPAGHNPECYRLFEAVEAGSIPVLSRDDLYGKYHIGNFSTHPCKDALHNWYEAPIIVLKSWNDLYPTIKKLLEDPVALDEQQVKLRMWYNDFMRRVVVEFEDYMLESPV